MLTLTVEVAGVAQGDIDQFRLEHLAEAILESEGMTGDTELSLLITDDAGMRELNRRYRAIDAATDVLSFSLLPDANAFVAPPDGVLRLGDIVISYEQAAAQAAVYGHSVGQEVAELFVHGLFHILGYDHEQEAAARLMAEKEEAIFARQRSAASRQRG